MDKLENIPVVDNFPINVEEDKKSQNKEIKTKEFNDTDKYGTSQDIPNMYTPMNSIKNPNMQNNQLKKTDTNINNPKIEEDANEIEEGPKNDEEINDDFEIGDIEESPDKEEKKKK